MKPDFSKMTGQELLDAYNNVTRTRRRAWAKTAEKLKSTPRKTARQVKLLVNENPRREGTDAHAHFEAMRKYPQVEDYLARSVFK